MVLVFLSGFLILCFFLSPNSSLGFCWFAEFPNSPERERERKRESSEIHKGSFFLLQDLDALVDDISRSRISFFFCFKEK